MEGKYRPYPQIDIPNRTWPSKTITKAPDWCSVDLRDGNQALITPMTLDEKLEFFKLLVDMGFKEIEVGFPSASQVEFDFMRKIIDDKLGEGVKLQVLVQARKHLIERTFEAIKGAKNAIVHVYNSTSTNQRKIVFQKDRQEIIDIAVQGVKWIKEYSEKTGQKVTLEYSPESFTGTEIDYAVEVCNAVIEEWGPTPDNKIIINLPATVELSTPNIYADMVEWVCNNLKQRENVIVSLHTHNDRGSAVAATELALLAGADRVEGTLFGNGERTGNADILTIALNMYTQGVDPKLDFSDINSIIEKVERFNKIPVGVRHPYAGELVYTAFSGSHQDAISKGFKFQSAKDEPYWEVPYLPIDPADLGRNYEGIIRINSQSGKGGVAYILDKEYGYTLPKAMHPEVAQVVQAEVDKSGKEINKDEIYRIFDETYLKVNSPFEMTSFKIESSLDEETNCAVKVKVNGDEKELKGSGNGPIDACKNAMDQLEGIPAYTIHSYSEHSLEQGSTSKAVAYVEIELDETNRILYGVGIDTNITKAAVKALFCAVNRAM